MKKWLTAILTVAFTICLGLGVSACGKHAKIPPHEHTFSSAWTWDKESHWHAATCEHQNEISGKAAHTYANGTCTECGYAHEDHVFKDAKCTICGYALAASELRYEEIFAEDGQTVTGYTVVGWAEGVTDRSQLIIPAEHEGHPVAAVGESAFDVDDGDGDETLTFVYLPETVKDLGEYAFYGCSGLKTINLESVENVYDGAFYSCTGLEKAEMGTLNTLGKYAFYDCASLAYAKVEGVETFADQAFRKCPALARVDFGDGVQTIPQFTFYESPAVREITLGKEFSQAAEELEDVSFPDGLEKIEVSADNAMYATEGGILYNKAKTQIIFVPLSITGKVTIADGVTEIKARASHFKNHARMISLTIPASVLDIQNGWVTKTFAGCSTLAEIYNLTEIEIAAYDDFGLDEGVIIHSVGSEKSVVTDPDADGFVWRTDSDTLHAYFGQEKELVLPDGHGGRSYAVAANAFASSTLTKVTIPANVTSLGANCFASSSVEEVVIQEGLTEIGAGAFYECLALTKISIPKSVKKIGAGAFTALGGTSALERVDYAGNVSEWASIVFKNEYSNIFVDASKEKKATLYLGDGKPLPEKIVIEGIESIGSYAFYGAPIRELSIGQGVKNIGQDAFSYCGALETVVLGKDVEYFYYAFAHLSVATVYYEGTQETWGTLNRGNGGGRVFSDAQVYFFAASAPESGDAWHYDDKGDPVVW